MRKHQLFSILILTFFSAGLYAQAAPAISCNPRELISDSGYSVTIEKTGTRFDYTFSQNSYSGPKILSQKVVSLEAMKAGNFCRIHVLDSEKQDYEIKTMFNLERTGNTGKWNLTAIPGSKAPDLVCIIGESLAKQFCANAYEPQPIPIVPYADSADDENPISHPAK